MTLLRTTIPIAASPQTAILVDFDRWPAWNPSVPRIRGEARGPLVPVFRTVMGPAIQHHHDNLNKVLKRRAEAAAGR